MAMQLWFGRFGPHARTVAIAVLVAAALFALVDGTTERSVFATPAFAQGQGSGAAGNSAGGGPGNQGTSVGGQGASTGPGARNRAGRGGSGGDGPVPSPIGEDGPLIGGGDKSAPATVTAPDWCADYAASTQTRARRISGANLKRLDAARRLIAPDFHTDDVRTKGFPLYNLAQYQEVFEQAEPDVVLAGTYLGLTASVPITQALVARVNALLCVKGDDTTITSTATVADKQRRSML